MYYEGRGTKQNLEKAFVLYDEVASSGDGDALFMTARMLYSGLGIAQDTEEAMERFGRSAAAGNKLAEEFLTDIRRKQNAQFVKIDGL
jgi:TPR repeat protein